MTAPVCAWCFDPLGEVADEFNDGVGHPECARWAYRMVAGPDPLPWPRRRFYRRDPMIDFLERLGCEAARLGIDRRALAAAVVRARHA